MQCLLKGTSQENPTLSGVYLCVLIPRLDTVSWELVERGIKASQPICGGDVPIYKHTRTNMPDNIATQEYISRHDPYDGLHQHA